MRITRKTIFFIIFVLISAAFIYWSLPYLPLPITFTDVWRYGQLTQHSNQLLAHFPKGIPSDATNVRFYYAPGFMQGSTIFQLRMQLPSAQIVELYKHFSMKKTKSFWGGHSNNHMNEREGMPTTFFYTNRKQKDFQSLSFSDDYELMIFDKVIPEKDRPKGFYWNHGRSHGVAISTKRDEIVYWAEAW